MVIGLLIPWAAMGDAEDEVSRLPDLCQGPCSQLGAETARKEEGAPRALPRA